MGWKEWLHGLASAIVGGAASAVGGVAGANAAGVPMELAWPVIKGAAIGGAVLTVAAYLKKSPLPKF